MQTPVSVYESASQRTLNVGGLHQANDSQSMVLLHRRIGALPMALPPSPESALVIGLGGGAPAASRDRGPIVELSESVRLAAPYFAHVTYDVLQQPNVRVRVDDGRNFLALSGERFDVITADIIQPVHAGAGHLYSREYFELVRGALKPGGLALQWIGRREKVHYELIMRTFLEVFPNATLWLDGELMVGSIEPLQVRRETVERALAAPASGELLRTIGLDSFDALDQSVHGRTARDACVRGAGPAPDRRSPAPRKYYRSLPSDHAQIDLSTLRGRFSDVLTD